MIWEGQVWGGTQIICPCVMYKAPPLPKSKVPRQPESCVGSPQAPDRRAKSQSAGLSYLPLPSSNPYLCSYGLGMQAMLVGLHMTFKVLNLGKGLRPRVARLANTNLVQD